jgi:hypothetical protein
LISGPTATIYRPDATLFVLLKLRRLSETDLEDCQALLDLVKKRGLPIDAPRLTAALAAVPDTTDAALSNRRMVLVSLLGERTG